MINLGYTDNGGAQIRKVPLYWMNATEYLLLSVTNGEVPEFRGLIVELWNPCLKAVS